MSTKTKQLLCFLAMGIGMPVLLLFTTLVENVFFKEVNFCMSSLGDLAIKALGILFAGFVTGFMASLIVVRTSYLPHLVLSAFVIIKLFFVVGCPFTGNPIWYDAMNNVMLIGGLWLGFYAALRFPLAPV